MKIIIPMMSMFMFLSKMNMNLIIISLLIFMSMMNMMNNKMMIMNQICYMDQLSYIMTLLSLMSVMLIILSTNSYKKIMTMLMSIMLILIMTFSMHNMLYFYMLFEFVLIPTMILIMKLGKQPERLQAGVYMLMYTITASLPLLISIIFMKNNLSFLFSFICIYKFKLIIMMMMAFLVKMPMYFTHLWLPKAHVEAPLEGSMILAAILLKLGGYGLIRFFPMFINKINSMNYWIVSISILGATATNMNCVRQKDLKSLIAYSSVAHMGLTLCSVFISNSIGLTGAIMMMVAHGLSSSALFLLTNDLYMKMHTRNIFLFKGLMLISPNIMFWWFMFMAVNMSAPPSINTLSEIFIMSSMIMWSSLMLIPIMLTSLSTASFSMSMFVNIYHNKNESLPSPPSNQKMFMSLFLHLIPLILFLMKMEIMYM